VTSVLLVDDDATVRNALELLLTEDGHTVTTACDGFSAVALARAQHFDAVVTDYEMPGKNGIDLVNDLAAGGLIGERSVVLISGAGHYVRDRFIVDTLRKPFVSHDLLQRVAEIIAAGRA
jgi:CheY-like chemotaxis protein